MKRILSIILTLCMIISLLPTISLVSAADVTYKYDFNPNDAKDERLPTAFASYDKATTGEKWMFVVQNGMSNNTYPRTYINKNFYGIRGVTPATGSQWWVAVKVKIPTAGTYAVKFGYGTAKDAGKMDVYVLPATTTSLTGTETVASIAAAATKLTGAVIDTNVGTSGKPSAVTTVELSGITTQSPDEERIVVFAAPEATTTTTNIYFESLTLTRPGDANICTVSYNANGGAGTMSAQTVTKGEVVTLTQNAFTRDGFLFNGWNTKADGTGAPYANEADFTATESTTLYAQWIVDPNAAKVYKYVLNPSGSEKVTLTTGYEDYDNEKNPMWKFVARTGMNYPTYPMTYTSGTFKGIRAYINPNTSVWWFALKLKVPAAGTYDATLDYGYVSNGGKMDVYVLPKGASLNGSETITQIANKASKLEGGSIYTKVGDNLNPSKDSAFLGSITTDSPDEERIVVFAAAETTKAATYMFVENITLKEQDPNLKHEYTIDYDANGGDSVPARAKKTEEDTISLPAAPMREGYNFLGWSDGTEVYAAGASYTVSKHVLFTAQWEPDLSYEFTITYDVGGGSFSTTTIQAPHGTMTLPEEIPTYYGYSFKGWSDGSAIYSAGDSYTVSKKVTFTAQWEEVWMPPEGATYADDRVTYVLDSMYDNFEGVAWTNPSYTEVPVSETGYRTISDAKKDICGFREGHGITSDYTDGWSWYGYDTSIKLKYNTFLISQGKFMKLTLGEGKWVALKANFKTEGIYRVALNYLGYNAVGAAEVYLIPVPEQGKKVTDYLTKDYKIGKFESYDSSVTAYNAEGAERSEYIGGAYVGDADDDYLIVFKGIKSIGGKSLIYINDIIFSGTSPITGIKTPGKALAKGESLTLGADMLSWEANIPEYTENCEITYENLTPEILDLSGNVVTALVNKGEGKIKIKVKGTELDYSAEYELVIVVGSLKERSTYYTEEKVTNARNNIKRYDWARDEMKSAKEKADEYIRIGADKLWDMVTTQGLPRAQRMNARINDTGNTDCIYCGKQLGDTYGDRPWEMDPINKPWKLQCPECGKSFPSNDFGSFYELGIDEHKNWDFELALKRHHNLVYHGDAYTECDGSCGLERPAVAYCEGFEKDGKCTCTPVNSAHTLEVWLSGEWRTDAWKTYYGYGDERGYLYNKEFSLGTTDANGRAIDKTYCVDDGWGYDYIHHMTDKETGEKRYDDDGNPILEKRIEPFIAFYNYHGVWGPYGDGVIYKALQALSEAYVYTDNPKYGKVGAILVDRIADVYKDFDCTYALGVRIPIADNSYAKNGQISGVPRGVIFGKLHDTTFATHVAKAYDAFWPALKDPDVKAFLSEKARTYGLENPKKDEIDIARNIENNFLRVLHKSRLESRYDANFPLAQIMHILAGVVLDTSPESEEWIDFEFKEGGKVSAYEWSGGNITSQLYVEVTRDGHGNEAAPGYNTGWLTNLRQIGEIVGGYDRIPNEKKTEYNVFANPSFIRMLTAQIEILCATTASPNIGDHDKMGRQLYGLTDKDTLLFAYELLSREEYKDVVDEEMLKNIARYLYRLNGKKLDNIHGNIFMAEPEGIVDGIEDIIDETSAIILPSQDFAGYGLAMLRAGNWFMPDRPNNVNTQRNFYIWYGQMDGHGHADKLGLAFYAYGLEVGADPGEAEVKDGNDPHRWEFDRVTQSHNTVTVDNTVQRNVNVGYPKHFDDAGKVQVTDVENAEVYDWLGVDEYRRTLVMVDANDDISYGVDFFHVSGGKDHLYSFHAMGKEAELLMADGTKMEVTPQVDASSGEYIGSYQHKEASWGGSTVNSLGGLYSVEYLDDIGQKTDGLGTYSWFGEVDRAGAQENADVFSVDWKIVDRMHALNPAQRDLRVRLTMLNSFKLDEITTTSAIPAHSRDSDNKINKDKTIRYLFARHTGKQDGKAENEKLDTLFTSVVEPYNKDRYIKSIEKVNVTRGDDAAFTTDEAKAVKVTLTNGRVDYIVYAKDTTVPYKVHYKTSAGEDKTFDFCGFVGVVSMVNDKVIYSYVNDGETVADKSGLTSAYTGNVEDFQREITTNNYIDVSFNEQNVDLENLAGRYIYVDNDHTIQNGSYRIEKAEPIADGVRLYVGNTSLILNAKGERLKENRYNVEEGQTFRIPLSYVEDDAPTFETLDDVTTTAGNSTTATVKAIATGEATIKEYKAVTLPRGASFDGATGKVTWKPDESQIGDNLVQIDAIDNSGRVSRINFAITVYGKTTGADEGTTGGGGGGGAPLPDDDTDNDTATDDTPNTGDDAGDESGENTDDTSMGTEDGNLRFIDLGNHAWAEEAINALADAGIIKGTSENEYSPANNITRADYAILLVRAFGQTSDNTENFDDVNVTDYFAHELAIARNTGIVGGIRNNMFAPRKNIMRQDMMLMTYRALKALGIELTVGEVDAPDLDKVDGYALDAVRALISNGLVNGKNGYIDPKAYTTRAEVAVLLKRILDFAK